MEYNDMLDRAMENVDTTNTNSQRFDVDTPQVEVEGSFTLYRNFIQTANYLGRDTRELLTFFQNDLATNGRMRDEEVVRFKGEFTESDFSESLEKFVRMFVECDQCNSPDTRYEEQAGVEVIRCTACGATNPKPDQGEI